ncbi:MULTISPECIES: HlyD family secretion protein [unclassified Devosia]|uniref:HlyD family secretion protein n=1 Tax=unclassified Devosia TaxID=196773 RepID=UPI00145CF561|nr:MULTISPECIES: HlyD family secretion protein [unclassified Devosia]MBJ6988326.1 HlyD family secretion protein [Devosia sp. MC521]MBJ7579054.1 HlyD family secretion protein [Devosia sp. MC532]QMW63057.1 HlyD family secretion protein [Devosia sp. MC521]
MAQAVTPSETAKSSSTPAADSKAHLSVITPASTDETAAVATEEPSPELVAAAKAKRKKAGRIALVLVLVLVGIFAWYPLSDRHAPFASAGSITADVTQIAARVAGPVTKVTIRDNASVSAGDTLFTIDDTTYRMDVELAKAQLEQALNSVSSNAAAIPASQAKLDQAQLALANAVDELDRQQQLHAKGLVSPSKLAQAELAKSNAELTVQAARADLERTTTASGAADATNPNIRTARANLEKAEFALANTKVVAPAHGYVTNVSLTEGQFVGAGAGALTFINPATQMVIADFRENQLINVEPGDKATVVFEAAPGKKFSATVESIAWGINSGRATANGLAQPTTDTRWFPPARKIPVRIALDDLSELPANIRIGSEASVLIDPNGGFIPAISQALLTINGFISGLN